MPKSRLDKLIVALGLLDTREAARGAIMAGLVSVNGIVEDKPGHLAPADAAIELKGKEHPFVSRGGMKLARALEEFALDVNGLTALDIGASTGGFTDCLLQAGAARVFAVDVGKGQLDQRLRGDPRVTCLEGVNARYLTPAELPCLADLVTIDVSFISLSMIVPPAAALLSPSARGLVALVKPQFEAGREAVGRGGVVRDLGVRAQCIERVVASSSQAGLHAVGLVGSPIHGPKGNAEFLLYLSPFAGPPIARDLIEAVVAAT